MEKEKVKPFQCEKCPYKSYEKGNLTKHVRSVHEKIRDFHREKCPYRTSRKDILKQHVRSVHEDIWDFHCDKCPYKTSTKSSMNYHVKAIFSFVNNSPYFSLFVVGCKGFNNLHVIICYARLYISKLKSLGTFYVVT